MLFKTRSEYITEESLGECLVALFPKETIKHNHPLFKTKYKADYFIENLKLIIEFDGYRHFTDPNVFLRDRKKDKIANENDFFVIRIPYFLQLDRTVLQVEFAGFISEEISSRLNDFTSFGHGFIDEKAALPSQYCSLGRAHYQKIMKHIQKSYDKLYQRIQESLLVKASRLKSVIKVFDIMDNESRDIIDSFLMEGAD